MVLDTIGMLSMFLPLVKNSRISLIVLGAKVVHVADEEFDHDVGCDRCGWREPEDGMPTWEGLDDALFELDPDFEIYGEDPLGEENE